MTFGERGIHLLIVALCNHYCQLKHTEIINQCEMKYSRSIKEISATPVSTRQHVLGHQQHTFDISLRTSNIH